MAGAAFPHGPQLLEAVTQQEALIADLARRLHRAERAVAAARDRDAAATAHRRADALLLDLEAAEEKLRLLLKPAPQISDRGSRRRRSRQPDQDGLFDVG